ncbi:hypothetical protein GGR54DRAFT_629336 [Hypoxylon sp. NC1633]|nr:hypothetical protein GGR54DRAFT_629336 [Hypoxylon sp. NC1633]
MQLTLDKMAMCLAFLAPGADALLRFSCSQLVVERMDPLVFPGLIGSPHVHQIVGGNAFNASMEYPRVDLANEATCTTCTFSEDLSNYWTAILYFRAQNGTCVTAFQHGFRMLIGNPYIRTEAEAKKYRDLTYTCLDTPLTRSGETLDMPKRPCPYGIMANVRFPTCWDGVNLDSDDHTSHVAYPANGTFLSGGPCPLTHPVKIPQLFFEVVYDTTPFNDPADWPTDGTQPFIWSFGDQTGYGNHGDYVFGWKGTVLQQAMDANCSTDCPMLQTQSIDEGNLCTQLPVVDEPIDGWLTELPGGVPVTDADGNVLY